MEYLTDRYTAHLAAYNQHTKAHIRSLASSFSELGLCREDIQSSFDGFAAAAEVVWSEACTSLELEVQGLRERVASDLTEARKVRESLGDTDEPDVELAACEQEFESDRAPPLRQLADRVERRMAYWSRRKQDRLAEYESAMAATSAMRAALGLPQPAAVMTSGGRTDMSREKIDALRAEQTRLLSDRERRLGRLVPMLAALGARCTELGEPPSQVLADVHHTLWPYHESLGNSSDRPGTCGGDDHASASASVLTSAVDLSDGMFERLAVKAQAMAELKAERESQASAHTALLTLLWRELRIPRDEHERASLEPLLHGASRLHGTTIAKCRAAIWHLEDAHLDSMKSLVVAIAGELEDMCRESLMPPPDVAGILGEMNAPDRRPGDVGDVLGAMVRMQSNLAPECGRRAELVAIVNQLEVAREEVAWLAAYEADDNRFKGRDGHSNLQRSIRAARVRERTPALVSAFNLLAAEWRRREGCAFAVWGDDYAELVLPSLTADLDASMADHKAATLGRTASIRRASGGGGMEPPSPQSHRPGGWAPLPRAPSMSASGGGLAKEHKGPQPPAPARGGPEPRRATGSRGGGSESLRESGVYGTPPTGPRTSRGAPMAPPPPRGATPTHTTPSRRVSDGGSISAAATPRKAGAATYGTPLRSSTTTPLRSSTTTPMTARPAAGGAPAYSGGKVDGTLTARARLEARPTPPQHQHQQQMRSSHSKIPTASARAEGYGGEPHVAKAVAAAAAHEYDSDVTDDAVGPRDAPRAQPASSPKPGAAVASPGAGVRAWTPRSRRGVSEGGNNGGERGDCSPPGSSDSSGKAAGGGSSAARQLAVANAGGSARWSGNFRTDTSKASTPTC